MRRILVIVAALSAVLLTTPGSATAVVDNQRFTSPSSNGAVASVDPIPIEVTLERDCALGCDGVGDDEVRQVVVNLLGPTGKSVGSTSLSLLSGETRQTQVWGGRSLDPMTLSDFDSPDVCNGGWTLEASISWVNPVGELRTTKTTRGVTLSAPPTAPSKVDVTTGIEEASLSWQEVSGYDDLKGYAIERSTDGGKTWKGVGGVAVGTHSFTDDSAPAGQVAYRVSSLRADGLTSDDRPAEPCQDDSGSFVSSANHPDSNVRYATAGGSVQAAPSPTGDDGGSGGGSDGGSQGAVAGSGGDGGNQIGTPPPPTNSGSSPNNETDSPELPGVGAPPPASSPEPERFYGEDLEFQRELNYGNQEAVEEPGQQGTPDEVVIDENIAAGESERFLNLERIAVPVAVGLVLIALGLHLRRWMNAPVTAAANGGAAAGGPPDND